jgi:hypothetical protein
MTRSIAVLACLATLTAEARSQATWETRLSAGFPAATAVFRHGNRSQFFAGYSFEVAAERALGRGLAAGASLVATGGLAPGVCESDLVTYDTCDDPLGRGAGVFATLRQFVPRSLSGAHLAGEAGMGFFIFNAFYRGKETKASGPTWYALAEAETGRLWRLSCTTGVRAQMIFDLFGSPVLVNTWTLGVRAR